MTEPDHGQQPDTGLPSVGQAKVGLREQADEAGREVAMRHRIYPGLVKRGRMTEAEAAVGIARMRAIRDTLRLFAEHEDTVRAALTRAVAARRRQAEISAVRELPFGASELRSESRPDAPDLFPANQPSAPALAAGSPRASREGPPR